MGEGGWSALSDGVIASVLLVVLWAVVAFGSFACAEAVVEWAVGQIAKLWTWRGRRWRSGGAAPPSATSTPDSIDYRDPPLRPIPSAQSAEEEAPTRPLCHERLASDSLAVSSGGIVIEMLRVNNNNNSANKNAAEKKKKKNNNNNTNAEGVVVSTTPANDAAFATADATATTTTTDR